MVKYGLSIVAAAMVLGVLKSIGGKSRVLEWAGGLFLALVILQPLAGFDFSDITEYMENFSLKGSQMAAIGKIQGDEAYRSVIKAELESYILDKAGTLGAELEVEVTLGEGGLPEEVILRGPISPSGKAQLVRIMEEDLAISKENQIWIG